eukprot:755709-Hanusia_phi.AAC.1
MSDIWYKLVDARQYARATSGVKQRASVSLLPSPSCFCADSSTHTSSQLLPFTLTALGALFRCFRTPLKKILCPSSISHEGPVRAGVAGKSRDS